MLIQRFKKDPKIPWGEFWFIYNKPLKETLLLLQSNFWFCMGIWELRVVLACKHYIVSGIFYSHLTCDTCGNYHSLNLIMIRPSSFEVKMLLSVPLSLWSQLMLSRSRCYCRPPLRNSVGRGRLSRLYKQSCPRLGQQWRHNALLRSFSFFTSSVCVNDHIYII